MGSVERGAIAAGLWVVVGLAALATRALNAFSHSKLQEVCRRRRRPARMGVILQDHDAVALATATVEAIGTAGLVLVLLGLLTDGFSRLEPLAAGVVLAAAAVWVAGVWIPSVIVPLWGEAFLYAAWPALRVVQGITWPLVAVYRFFRAVVYRLAGQPQDEEPKPVIEEELRSVVDEGQREGVLEPGAREMLESVIELPDVQVADIMTPRTEMVCLPVHASLEAACAVVRDHGHSRIPLMDKNRDDIVGILYAKDLLVRLGAGDAAEVRLRDVMREPFFVPETKPVLELLREMQRRRIHMAVVLDEYGGTSGLVTIEDIVEEVVGEIADEYDAPEGAPVIRVSDTVAEVDARLHIDEANAQLGLHLPEDEDYDTIGGFAFSQLGRIPKVGETFQWAHIRFTVLDASKRKINRLRLELLSPQEPD